MFRRGNSFELAFSSLRSACQFTYATAGEKAPQAAAPNPPAPLAGLTAIGPP